MAAHFLLVTVFVCEYQNDSGSCLCCVTSDNKALCSVCVCAWVASVCVILELVALHHVITQEPVMRSLSSLVYHLILLSFSSNRMSGSVKS